MVVFAEVSQKHFCFYELTLCAKIIKIKQIDNE